jgi:hypothetical protein
MGVHRSRITEKATYPDRFLPKMTVADDFDRPSNNIRNITMRGF